MADPASKRERTGGKHAYPFPPITEAIIESQFESEASDDERRTVSGKLAEFYPSESVHFIKGVHVDVDAKTVEVKPENSVFRRSANDETELTVFGPKNFLISQLGIYPGWETFFGRFERDWALWRRLMKYRKVNRIGVRFINRIDVPKEGTKAAHEDYLNVYVHVPDEIETIGAYALQTQVPLASIKSLGIINSASVPSPLPGFASFMLDIDIGRNIDVPQKDADIFAVLNEIRGVKNALFESSIKDAAREKFYDEQQLR